MRIATLSLLATLCLALSAPTFAQLYNNGVPNGNAGAWYIDTYQVTDSFLSATGGTMTGFIFGEWVPKNTTPLTVDWAIGSTSFGTDIALGSSSVSSVVFCHASGTCGKGLNDVYTSTVTGLAIPIAGGNTYWLTLTNATDSIGGRDGWDMNAGSALAYSSCGGGPICGESPQGQVPSESFTILGSGGGTTPEPGSIVLFGSGFLGLAGVLRRRLRR